MNPMLLNIIHNPLVKSLVTAVIGAVGPVLLSAFDHFAPPLAYAGVYAVVSLIVHDLWSAYQLQNPTPAQGAASNVAAAKASAVIVK